MIELRHLRTLIALKETGSLAGAAKKRFVTQSALSHQIKELETRIDAQLFIRKSKPLNFTPEGQRLISLAEKIIPEVIAAEQELKAGLEQQRIALNVGVECQSCYRWMQPALERFRVMHPDVDINFTARHGFQSLDALEANDIDLVFTSDPTPSYQIQYQHLFDFEVRLLTSKNHSLAHQEFVSPQQLTDSNLLTYPLPLDKVDLYKHFLAPAQVTIGQQKQCELTLMLMQRVASGDGVTALPIWSIPETHGISLASISLGKDGLHRPLFSAINRSTKHQDLLNQLKNEICLEASQYQLKEVAAA
ncbi:LysR substrate-binding domain-containing protein [Paraferrimonas sp. SM1919]|uniref:LysR substrate-binding domain-containing protein n=1 Tax=Paraferrimonas sp. SM1919 TaxID=2662263 RepID=UPI0013D5A210|nr:LysR substrate-binding domain-containing protein [Paraferrimonas sp. SM1919]